MNLERELSRLAARRKSDGVEKSHWHLQWRHAAAWDKPRSGSGVNARNPISGNSLLHLMVETEKPGISMRPRIFSQAFHRNLFSPAVARRGYLQRDSGESFLV